MYDVIGAINNIVEQYTVASVCGIVAAGAALGAGLSLLGKDDVGLRTGLEGVIKETTSFIGDTYGQLYIARGRGMVSPFDDPDVRRALFNARRQGVQVVEKYFPNEGYAVMVGGRLLVDLESGEQSLGLTDTARYSKDYKTVMVFRDFPILANDWRGRISSL